MHFFFLTFIRFDCYRVPNSAKPLLRTSVSPPPPKHFRDSWPLGPLKCSVWYSNGPLEYSNWTVLENSTWEVTWEFWWTLKSFIPPSVRPLGGEQKSHLINPLVPTAVSIRSIFFSLFWSKWDHRFGPKSVRPTEREIFFVERIWKRGHSLPKKCPKIFES